MGGVVGLDLGVESGFEDLVGPLGHGVDQEPVAGAEQAVDGSGGGADRVGDRSDRDAGGSVLVVEPFGRGP